MSRIAWCCLAQNRLSELREAIRRVEGHVDHMIVVDGGSVDDSLFYLKARGDVDVVLAPWRDDFSWSRNQYVERARALGCTHILVGDTDEWWSPWAMANMRTMVDLFDSLGAQIVQFRDVPVTMRGEREVARNDASTFYKPLLYRLAPGFHYRGNPHHEPVYESPVNMASAPPEATYSHVKQAWGCIAHRGARNFYIGNSNRFGDKWRKFRALVNRTLRPVEWTDHVGDHRESFDPACAVCTAMVPWHDFDRELMCLAHSPRLMSTPVTAWIVNHRHDDGDGDSEVRELFLLCFAIYHPSLNPFPSEHIAGQECSIGEAAHATAG